MAVVMLSVLLLQFKGKSSIIEKSKFIKYIKNLYPQLSVSLSQLDNQVNIESRTEGGCVKIIRIGNIKLSGIQIRKILNLNSANFTIDYSGNEMKFTIKGYGHGVGMSQYGANYLANQGFNYEYILKYYYKDVIISSIN